VSSEAEAREILALRLSLALTVLFAGGATVITLISDSETMTLEAMSALIDIVVCVLALFVARKVREPANPRYHFGYAKYEPLMTTVEGVLLAGVCVGAIVYASRDLVHPDPVDDTWLVLVYSGASFLACYLFGAWMRRAGRQAGSQLVLAEADLWIVDGFLALGVCLAFVAGMALDRWAITSARVSAYVDPVVCIALSLIFLKKPLDILRESIADLVDANPFAGEANAVEESARALGERFRLRGLEGVRVRKAGRRVFALVSFFEAPGQSLEEMDRARQAVVDEMRAQHPDVEVAVLFRPAPAGFPAPGAA
jgi:cation diffusion facilitator family transporter